MCGISSHLLPLFRCAALQQADQALLGELVQAKADAVLHQHEGDAVACSTAPSMTIREVIPGWVANSVTTND